MEQLSTQMQIPWRELQEARVKLDSAPEFIFTMLERADGVRAGAWLVYGRPLALVPVARA